MVVLLSVLFLGMLFYFIGPTNLVNFLGVRNSYLILFLFASVGGLSVFTSSSFCTVIISLAIGGINPLLLALTGAFGLIFGNSLFYYFGFKGRNMIPRRFKSQIFRLTRWLKKQNPIFINLFIFLYAGFTPLPSDVLMISLALAKYPYKKVIILSFLGNFILLLLISLLALKGVNLF